MTNHAYPQFGSQQMAPPSQQQQQQQSQHLMGGMGGSVMPGIGSNQLQSMGLPSLMQTPAKIMQTASSYQPSYATPQQNIIQPQTPVRLKIVFLYFCKSSFININYFQCSKA